MCWSRSTPNSLAPLKTSSRLTPRAKALSLSFFLTPAVSTSWMDLLGLMSAQAVRKPASSSQAKRLLSRWERRGVPVYSAWPRMACRISCGQRHQENDACLGRPLCPDCYDYNAAVVWNAHASELWRRTVITVRRPHTHVARKNWARSMPLCR